MYTELKRILTEKANQAGIATKLFWNETEAQPQLLTTDQYPFILCVMPNTVIGTSGKEYSTSFTFYIGVTKDKTETGLSSSNLNTYAEQIYSLAESFKSAVNESDENITILDINVDSNGGFGYFLTPERDITFRFTTTIKLYCDLT